MLSTFSRGFHETAFATLAAVVLLSTGVALHQSIWMTGVVTLHSSTHYAVSAGEKHCHAYTSASCTDAPCERGLQLVDVLPLSDSLCSVTCCPSAPPEGTCYYSESCGGSCASGFDLIHGPADIATNSVGPCDRFCCTPGRYP